ncbi:PRC-barrel domain-containing protein [Cohaesibacter sp. ES.047]|uniref:PRC-barrel domain-containing protein n=1 Tax=Cohaesibacter sp. ES.047 TaxID=1798205 RepID=UPI000BBFC304|nr:PRC-barrel domain-containing protein [Cohaesibacter sp. ES.047]SNY93369.1 PRC-barrel domain-containing protein [Cohaesibacter sp. ES.047]
MAHSENHNLIGSDRVEGTYVYDKENVEIGHIDKLMLEKQTGRVAYAVVKFGDVFGLGGDQYPLPWEKLEYDEKLDAYRLDVSRQDIEGAPKYPESDSAWTPELGRNVYGYYGIPPYWMI